MEVNNKVAIVTGGIRGIGLATVQCLLRKGAKYVALLDIMQADNQIVVDGLQTLEQEFEANKFGYYVCDVSKSSQFQDCYEKVLNSQNYVDILVNNAGLLHTDNIELLVDVNFKSIVTCTLYAISKMSRHKGYFGGVIVNVASITGLVTFNVSPLYSATKHGVVAFVRSMKEHYETLGIRIVCVCPHRTDTNLNSTAVPSKVFDFIDINDIKQFLSIPKQRPLTVGLAIVQMIEGAEAGDVWVSQCDEPPFKFECGDNVEKIQGFNL